MEACYSTQKAFQAESGVNDKLIIMRTILYLIQKELLQVLRNKTMLPIIFIVPIVQLLILVHAASLEMKSIDMYIVDKDLSSTSRGIVQKFESSPFYYINHHSFSLQDAENELKKGNIDIILHIPYGFESELVRGNNPGLQLLIDAINGTAAGLIQSYTQAVLADYNRSIMLEWASPNMKEKPLSIKITHSFWYNPELNYKTYMVPGILVLLVTLIGMILTSLNLVREKELGTAEQINVTPIRKYHFITGKLFPFWMIALFELAFGLLIGKLIFDIPIVGSLGLLFLFAAVYLFAILGVGLFISTLASTQQQVMFINFFFMLLFILMSGLFTPVETMPDWAQVINVANPMAYFMRVNRMILLKGSGFYDILPEFISISIYALIILSLAVWRYRKTV